MNKGLDKFILILYVGLIGWLLYRLYKNKKAKKELEGEIFSFTKRTSRMEYILFSLVLATGIINLIAGVRNKDTNGLITASVMIITGLAFMANTRSKLYISESGLIINDGYFSFKELKRWGFDKEKGDLVILVKKNHQESRQACQVQIKDIEDINNIIRKYKLGK